MSGKPKSRMSRKELLHADRAELLRALVWWAKQAAHYFPGRPPTGCERHLFEAQDVDPRGAYRAHLRFLRRQREYERWLLKHPRGKEFVESAFGN